MKDSSLISIEAQAPFWQAVTDLTEAGSLRRLSGVFARFIGAMQDGGAAGAPLLLACLLLSELEGRGHSCLMLDELAQDPAALMGWSEEQWQPLALAAAPLPKNRKAWCALLGAAGQVWQADQFDFGQPLVLDGERLYLRRYWRDETMVAAAIGARARGRRPLAPAAVHGWLERLFGAAAATAADPEPDWQRLACAIAVRGEVAIITGGPGTGKTYTVARLLALLLAGAGEAPLRVALAAPTGKAAARLKQSIDKALQELAPRVASADGGGFDLAEKTARIGPARTLHSLLGARPDSRLFAHHRANPLELDVLIVDEASMVHLEMMAALLDALPANATLILLGDKDQLSSVEAGAVLGDLCEQAEAGGYDGDSAAYALAAAGQHLPARYLGDGGALAQQTVMLRHSRRFGGPIGALALAVNRGEVGAAEQVLRAGAGLAWIEQAQQAPLLQLAVEGYRPFLQLLAGEPLAVLRAFEQFRLLCAVREGEWGVAGLNGAIEQQLVAARLIRKSGEWYVGRPVMVTRNDYGTRVYNGDIGVTLADPARPGSLRVYFLEGEQVRSVLATRLRHVETAFAMTVHKSQGSEFSHTVMVLPRAGGSMLARELIYTGITRARERFTLVTPVAAVLAEAIARKTRRASGLRAMLARA